ncbi:hypothetical protein PAEPH01_1385 [Pancytospora epiphaga]|nr:hypothetical protein PAEPH01_1385 [Pancytospora epiphaga]
MLGKTYYEMYSTNYLRSIDDLKLLAEMEEVLSWITKNTIQFFDAIGLEINKDKSTVSSQTSADAAVMLKGKCKYRCFKAIMNGRTRQSR